ncbi:hypothetical protein GVAV_003044 [Gurleya vavrai]
MVKRKDTIRFKDYYNKKPIPGKKKNPYATNPFERVLHLPEYTQEANLLFSIERLSISAPPRRTKTLIPDKIFFDIKEAEILMLEVFKDVYEISSSEENSYLGNLSYSKVQK